jgi:CDP-diglyceride synthetase
MARGWRQNSWVIPISAVILAVIMTSVPPFLRFDPARQPADLNSRLPVLDFALAEGHVLLATVALVTLCLNIWPWLRLRHVTVHRWSGRVYVFSALSASLLTLPIVFLNNSWQADIGASAIGAFWFTTTLIGYRAIRQRNEAKHRRWMLYSFAMATSVVWGLIVPPLLSKPDQFPYMVELVRWVGPLLNLAAVKWWLDRTAQQATTTVPFQPAARREHVHRRAA